ncbi:hypothetical protein DL95DRAFT_33181 [Leptodontidium sp. 2 PMI_412]|nr:hypothetical protein BKA61DRAFT_316198 [Leptodontidium sp. MPI-SDFR-AT-0119]KAH9208798.1 hypothetical protein DL95DRAFT_33181 [Leptodontidium sp. 2 PMI_412]
MSSSTTQPPFSDPFTTGPDKSGGCLPRDLPLHTSSSTSSSNYANAQAQQSTIYSPISPCTTTNHVSIPDGRRNSQGEVLPSPTEDWKPNFKRVQSWSREEFKRDVYKIEMVEEPGQGTGFTEGGKGTRKV